MNVEIISTVDNIVASILSTGPIISILIGFFAIVVESIFPFLPLAVMIAINILTFGGVLGFIISYVATVIGSMISFTFFDQVAKKHVMKKTENRPRMKKVINYIDTKSFNFLVILMAIPFTPAFMVNIAAGISDISPRKYFFANVVSKISVVYFWGFIGSNIYDSFTNPSIIIEIILVLITTYIVSKIISKKLLS